MIKGSKKIIIIGTGNMASTYYRHFHSLGCECYLSYRNKNSEKTIKAISNFGDSSLISLEESYEIEPDIVLSCTDVDAHLTTLLPFSKYKDCFLTSEKPISFSSNSMQEFPRRDVHALMNRRYYGWVEEVRNRAINGDINKIIVNLPERSSIKVKSGLPQSIIENSIHVFDLIYYIAGNFYDASYISNNSNSKLIITKSKAINEIIFNINFDSIEKFGVSFYLNDNTVIKSEPIENAFHFKSFNMIPPSKENFIRSYIPSSSEISPLIKTIDYQKTGILELCEDLITVDRIEETKLPNIDDVISFYNWLKLNWNINKTN